MHAWIVQLDACDGGVWAMTAPRGIGLLCAHGTGFSFAGIPLIKLIY